MTYKEMITAVLPPANPVNITHAGKPGYLTAKEVFIEQFGNCLELASYNGDNVLEILIFEPLHYNIYITDARKRTYYGIELTSQTGDKI